MPYQSRKGFFTFIFLSVIMTTGVTADNPSIYMRNDYYQITLTIDNAYYLDAEGDGLEDDVIAEFSIHTSKVYSDSYRYYDWDEWDDDDREWDYDHEWDDDREYYEYSNDRSCSYYKDGLDWNYNDHQQFEIDVKYKFRLKLPSGLYFDHEFERVITKSESSYQLLMLDHAIESGDYDFYVTINVNHGGWMRGTAWLTFDPPGGHGGDPLAMLY